MKLVMAQSNLTLMGGAERVLLKIAQHYNAKIYTAEYDRRSTFEGFKDIEIEVIGKGLPRFLPYGRVAQGLDYGLSFYNFQVKDDYDVINAHMSPSHWIRRKNGKVLWYCHTPPRDIYDLYKYRLSVKRPYQRPVYALGAGGVRIIDQHIVKKIEGIVANSENTKGRIARYYKREDAIVLPGGIEYKDFSSDGDLRYFVYPSRFSPNKRQEYAIEAFKRFKRISRGRGSYRLVLCGPVSRDRGLQEYYTKVKELAAKTKGVVMLGNVSEKRLRHLMGNSTAVLYTPIDEDYGLVPLEGMASCKPVIAVNEGGPASTISDGKTGFLVNSEDGMAKRMLYIIEHPKAADEIGRSGRREVEKKYSWGGFFRVFDREARKIAKA